MREVEQLDRWSSLKIILNAALTIIVIAAVYQLANALGEISSNGYLSDESHNLAGQILLRDVRSGVAAGAIISLGIALSILLIWPVTRVIFRSWPRGLTGAIVALPMMALLFFVGLKINTEFLPSFMSPISIGVNLVLVIAILISWFWLTRFLSKFVEKPLPILAGSRTSVVLLLILGILVVPTQVLAIAWRVSLPEDRPNVLLVLVDTLRADRLGTYGHDRNTSPNLDRLASEGWVFDEAIAQSSWTKPSMASLMTGLYVGQTSVGSGNWFTESSEGRVQVSQLAPEHLTMAEILVSAGYQTAGFGHNHHLIPRLGFAQGFLKYDWELLETIRLGAFSKYLISFRDEFSAGWINGHFLDWLGDNRDDPFFSYLHHIDVHWPYKAPAPYSGMFSDVESRLDFNRLGFLPDVVERVENGEEAGVDDDTLRAMLNAYDEGTRFVDDGIGEVFEELRRRGLYDNTLIIVTSDHGEEFLEHAMLGHGESLYDEVIRVPLIIKFPCPGRYCEPRRIDKQVELVDILPTVLSIVGVERPDNLVGRSLVDGEIPDGSSAFSELRQSVALRTSGLKFIFDSESDEGELYNLRDDPGEDNNIADSDEQVSELFTSRILDFIVNLSETSVADDTQLVEADDKMIENLRSLGYVQ